MIIAAQQNDIVKSGFDNSKKATINQDKLAKLQHLLTKGLYSDPISAVLIEWTNNAVDSVVQADKNPIEHPVLVKITENKLIVEDKGTGLNKEQFENVCMSYLSSTKEESNDVIGAFGIGMKSFMSLDRSATFTCRKDGKEWKFLAYQGVEFMEYDLLTEISTDKENGVICELPINGWTEFTQFRDKAKQKLAYYDTVILQIQNNIIDNQIVRSKDWQYSEYANYSDMHLCLKDVLYKIDWDKLGISKSYIPIALRFDLSEGLKPTPSRESLIWDLHTINLVKEKVKKVADYFVNLYNSQQKDEYELLEIFNKITDSNKYVTLGNEEFKINDLLQYATITSKELKIKGVDIMKPEFYYNLKHDLLDEYETLADYNRGKWGIKHVKTNHDCYKLLENIKHIEVDRVPTGLVKKFLLEKYPDSRILFIKKVNTRRLGDIKFSLHNTNKLNYTYILDLEWNDRQNWRNKIQEFQFVENQFKSLIINELNVENSNEYLKWLAKHKEKQKLNRKSSNYKPSGNYQRLNKTAEDITIQIAAPKEIGEGCKFVKKAIKFTDLNKLHKSTKALHIYFPEEQKERAKEYYELLGAKYSICILSPREIKRLPKIKNFMTETEFIQSRPFCKIMTSLKFEKAIDNFNDIYHSSKSEIIDNVLEKFKQQKEILQNYVRQNGKDVPDRLLQELKEIAKLQNLYDCSLDDVYNEFVKNTEKYSFLSCLKKPNSWEHEEIAKYKRLINSLLLMQQKYNNFQDLDIIVTEKPKEVTKIEEETILEEQLETV